MKEAAAESGEPMPAESASKETSPDERDPSSICFKSPQNGRLPQRKPGRRRLNPDLGDAHSIRDESALTAEGVDEGDGEIEEEMIDGFAILSFKTLAELRIWKKAHLSRVGVSPLDEPPLSRPVKPRRGRIPRMHGVVADNASQAKHTNTISSHEKSGAAAGDSGATTPVTPGTPSQTPEATIKRPPSNSMPTAAIKVPKIDPGNDYKNGVIGIAGISDSTLLQRGSSSASNGHAGGELSAADSGHPIDPGHVSSHSGSAALFAEPSADALRQAFLSNPGFAASLSAAAAAAGSAGFGNPFLAVAAAAANASNTPASAFPFLAAQILQQQQPPHHQAQTPSSGAGQCAPTSAFPTVGFPSLGSQLAGAAALGRAPMLPTSMPPSPIVSTLPVKKRGKWCAMHVKIAWDITHHKRSMEEGGAAGVQPPVATPSTSTTATAASAIAMPPTSRHTIVPAVSNFQPVRQGMMPPSCLPSTSSASRGTPKQQQQQGHPYQRPANSSIPRSNLPPPASMATMMGGSATGAPPFLVPQRSDQDVARANAGVQGMLGMGSLTNGTSDAGAAAMLAAAAAASLGLSQQTSGLNHLMLPIQNHPFAQNSSLTSHLQRLYDPSHTAAMLQQLSQNNAAFDARTHATPTQMNITMEQLMRAQLEQQQMIERYAHQLPPHSTAAASSAANDRDMILRQQLYAAHLRAAAPPPSQTTTPSLETLIELHRQQQLLAASRGFPTASTMPTLPTSQMSQMSQMSHMLGLGGYGKMPFTASLEQLARHKRDDLFPPAPPR